MELQRNPPPHTDPSLRLFTIRGVPQQIEVARHLIDEKVGVRTRPSPPGLILAGFSLGCPRNLHPPEPCSWVPSHPHIQGDTPLLHG